MLRAIPGAAFAAILVACAPAVEEPRPARTATSTLTDQQCEYFAVDGATLICHATGSARKPYVLISVSEEACAAAHADHPRDHVAAGDPTCDGQGCLAEGSPCDGTLGCCDGGSCDGGVCVAADLCAGVSCEASDQCRVSSCDPGTGGCVEEDKIDGFECDDADAGTVDDRCTDGTCAGTSCSALPPRDGIVWCGSTTCQDWRDCNSEERIADGSQPLLACVAERCGGVASIDDLDGCEPGTTDNWCDGCGDKEDQNCSGCTTPRSPSCGWLVLADGEDCPDGMSTYRHDASCDG